MKNFIEKMLMYGLVRKFDIFPFSFLSIFVVGAIIYALSGSIDEYSGVVPLALNSNISPAEKLMIDLYFPLTTIFLLVIAVKVKVSDLDDVVVFIEERTKYKRPLLMSVAFIVFIYIYFFTGDDPYGWLHRMNIGGAFLFFIIPLFSYATTHVALILFSFVRKAVK